MKTVKVQEAKTHLSALLVEVEQGATINIARGRQTVARLVPVGGERELGFGGYQLPDMFFDAVWDTSPWLGGTPFQAGGCLRVGGRKSCPPVRRVSLSMTSP